ncbi:hypothetical protein ACQKGD_01685 [Peribacillus frigoritolerans]|uniref:Uncharacterized protein n=2 Tax=Peribacillus frigoritolerans TaxID=450367 RepID=A0AAJ1QL22_9BACI|nr:hypothetical protein [Peribacillus frigoritolerans]MDM5283307.1 hypothetical protein [Peribacillus frigoritolerans]
MVVHLYGHHLAISALRQVYLANFFKFMAAKVSIVCMSELFSWECGVISSVKEESLPFFRKTGYMVLIDQ